MDFVIGGNRERMREMAFGNQVVNFENSDEKNSAVVRQKEIENWALDTYRWAANRYGEENIIGFNVHLDETTPHIHMQVIPVAEMKKRGRVKAGQGRGTKMTVSFAGVVGKNQKEYSAYKNQMHTDFFLQVGHKYGLERGAFFDDLTPEEQAKRIGHMTKAQFIAYMKAEKKLEEIYGKVSDGVKYLSDINDEIKTAEKKLKSFTKMLSNLNDQKEHLEIEITALEEIRDTGNEEYEKERKEKQRQLDEVNEKIATREKQLTDVQHQLNDLAIKKDNLVSMDVSLETISEDLTKDIEWKKSKLKDVDSELKEKVAEVAKVDRTGELEKARRHVDERDAVLYRRWPEARDAVKAIYDLANHPKNTDFTPQQALHVEHALVTSGTTRTDAANELMLLARKDFDNRRTFSGRIDGTSRVVQSIAANTHHRLTALLKLQPKNHDGSASYITDLTDWAGNQVKM
jgi:predicted  nucleic acid-binding Zn-ribbon protein